MICYVPFFCYIQTVGLVRSSVCGDNNSNITVIHHPFIKVSKNSQINERCNKSYTYSGILCSSQFSNTLIASFFCELIKRNKRVQHKEWTFPHSVLSSDYAMIFQNFTCHLICMKCFLKCRFFSVFFFQNDIRYLIIFFFLK